MSSPVLGLTMLGLIVIAIMMGFPTAFTMMGLGRSEERRVGKECS